MKNRFLPLFLAAVLTLGLMPMSKAAETSFTYDAAAAVSYAQKWATGRNPAYGGGKSNDCANFVSQCLVAGGLETDSTWKPGTAVWNAAREDSNNDLLHYLTNTLGATLYIKSKSERKDLPTWREDWVTDISVPFQDYDKSIVKPGMLIWTMSSSGAHVVICSKVENGTIYYCGHSNDRLDYTYGDLESELTCVVDLGTVTPPSLSIAPTTEPSANMPKGQGFYFRGSITSSSSITSATVSILAADGVTVVQTKTVSPNKASVDILNDGLDSLRFGKLEVGGYYLFLTATDASGATEVWSRPFSIGSAALPLPLSQETDDTVQKTQYRYHRYRDSKGNVSLCPYYGGSIFKSTMTLEYTDWMDEPLIKNSNPSGHSHINQGSACTNAGCVDPTRSTERFTDGSSNWYYEETRVVTEEKPVPTPTPTLTPTPIPIPTLTPTPTPVPDPIPELVTGTAKENLQTVKVDGKDVSFAMYSPDNGGTNYVRLVDLAVALKGTAGQFNVGYDGKVLLTTGVAYTGAASTAPFHSAMEYTMLDEPTYVNGVAKDLEGIRFEYQNGGYTYYKLRDLGEALGFNVGWDNATQRIYIESGKPYDPNN